VEAVNTGIFRDAHCRTGRGALNGGDGKWVEAGGGVATVRGMLLDFMRIRWVAAGLALAAACVGRADQAGAEGLVLLIGDQHSAYERTAQLVAEVDGILAANRKLPVMLLINGDSMEQGNPVARRSGGAVDFAMMAALAKRLPVVLNLGNHEAEFYPVAETVARLRAAGVTVIGNARDKQTGMLFAPESTRLKFGAQEAVVAGFATDNLATYPASVRASLELPKPADWARENLPRLLEGAPVKIVLSHSGVAADRGILPLLSDGTLLAGAHDHLAFVHREGRTVYVHSGSWNDRLTLAWLRNEGGGPVWTVEQRMIATDAPTEAGLAALIREARAKHLTAEDRRSVGRAPGGKALAPAEAARWVTEAARVAAEADVALIGNTTFGAGLPAGEVSKAEFDACIRFDNTLVVAEVDGVRLLEILASANPGPETAFARRTGEFLVATTGAVTIKTGHTYRVVTTDWVAKNVARYLGAGDIGFTPLAGVKLKAVALKALNP